MIHNSVSQEVAPSPLLAAVEGKTTPSLELEITKGKLSHTKPAMPGFAHPCIVSISHTHAHAHQHWAQTFSNLYDLAITHYLK